MFKDELKEYIISKNPDDVLLILIDVVEETYIKEYSDNCIKILEKAIKEIEEI